MTTALNLNAYAKCCNQTTIDSRIYEVEEERSKKVCYFLPGSIYIFTKDFLMQLIEQALLHLTGWLVPKDKLFDRCENTLFLHSIGNPWLLCH